MALRAQDSPINAAAPKGADLVAAVVIAVIVLTHRKQLSARATVAPPLTNSIDRHEKTRNSVQRGRKRDSPVGRRNGPHGGHRSGHDDRSHADRPAHQRLHVSGAGSTTEERAVMQRQRGERL